MLTKAELLILCLANLFESIYAPVPAPPFCKEVDHAIEQLEHYYTTFYRITHFWRTSTLCLMTLEQKKRCCAKIIKYCMGKSYEGLDLKLIEKEIKDVPECKKEKIEMTSKEGDPWKKKKRMFPCPSVQVCNGVECYRPTRPILISAGGLINTAIIFEKPKDQELIVKPLYFIENLNFETIKSKLKTVAEQEAEMEAMIKAMNEMLAKEKQSPEENSPAEAEKPTPKEV